MIPHANSGIIDSVENIFCDHKLRDFPIFACNVGDQNAFSVNASVRRTAPMTRKTAPARIFVECAYMTFEPILNSTIFPMINFEFSILNRSYTYAAMKSGNVMPNTYANVTTIAFQNAPDKTASAIAPAKTGAQHDVAAPDNMPRKNTDPT